MNQEKLRELINRYCVTLMQNMETIEANLKAFEEGGDNAQENFAEALNLTHQMTGISGSMGYPHISEAALALEYFMKPFVQNKNLPMAQDTQQLMGLFENFKDVAIKAQPEQSSLY